MIKIEPVSHIELHSINTHEWSDGVLAVDGEPRPRVVHGAVVVVVDAEAGDLLLGVLEEVAVVAGLDVFPVDLHPVVPGGYIVS